MTPASAGVGRGGTETEKRGGVVYLRGRGIFPEADVVEQVLYQRPHGLVVVGDGVMDVDVDVSQRVRQSHPAGRAHPSWRSRQMSP